MEADKLPPWTNFYSTKGLRQEQCSSHCDKTKGINKQLREWVRRRERSNLVTRSPTALDRVRSGYELRGRIHKNVLHKEKNVEYLNNVQWVSCIAQLSCPPPLPNYPRSLLTTGLLTRLLRICFSTFSRKFRSLSPTGWWLLHQQRLLSCNRGARI